jgi:UDP-N-acetylglucosamine:LPS N-acetylglucosamine transferase
MAHSIDPVRYVNVVEHPTLNSFNEEFGTETDISRYETIRSEQRVTSPSIFYLNELQMGSYIPTRIALLLKNNLQDTAFITHTSRSVLYQLKQSGKIGEGCFNFLHQKINSGDFLTVFKYLYIISLYTKIAQVHDAASPDPAFQFESPANYADRLVRSPSHTISKEEHALQEKSRIKFLKQWLTDLGAKPTCPREAQQQIFSLAATLESADTLKFREQFLSLLDQLKKSPELEKICWEELQSTLTPFTGKDFFEQTYLRLKAENYYKNCVSRVTALRISLDSTNGNDLIELTEKCKKAYNGCIYLLGDNKNMPACSPMRFAAIIGNMKNEWKSINHVFDRAHGQSAHRLCACQAQAPASQNELAEWPFNSHPLIPLNSPAPVTPQQLQQRGIDPAAYQENSKKTIAVIGCKWGGGHKEIARGISTNLASLGYHPVTMDLPEVLISEDPVRNFFLTRWLGKNWSIATLYAGLMAEKAFAIINFLRWFSKKDTTKPAYTETQLKLVMQELLKVNPDAVVIDYSADTEAVIKACEVLGIPCMHVATDINNKIETRDKPPAYAHFKMALPFNAREVIDPVSDTTTPEQRIFTGPPVKHQFTVPRTPEDIQRLKQVWGIDVNKKVVIIQNGGSGGFSTLPELLAKKYANTNPHDIPIHLVVLCGQENHAFKRHLEQNVAKKTNLPIKAELWSTEMEELMAMASYGGIVIGKAGAGTIFESIVRGNRLLIDNIRPSLLFEGFIHFAVTCVEMVLRKFGFKGQLFWEKDNSDFTKKHGLAEAFKNEADFLAKFDQMLNNDGRPVSHGIELKNVEKEIPTHLREMIVRAELDLAARRSREIRQNL